MASPIIISVPISSTCPGEPVFSIAGLWSGWTDKPTGEHLSTYAVLTTKANTLMEKVHNSKKRMPVIIPREFEKDWLNPNLTREDVIAFCQPFDTSLMDAYTISRMITDRKIEDKNRTDIYRRFEYPEPSYEWDWDLSGETRNSGDVDPFAAFIPVMLTPP